MDQIELSVPVFGAEVTDQRHEAAERIGTTYGLDAESVRGSPHFLVGTINGIAEELQRRRELYGFSYIVFSRGTQSRWRRWSPG